jgi:magnesium chelatase family protein
VATATTHTMTVIGVIGHELTIEADISNGRAEVILAGLPDSMLRETRDRVRAAIINSGLAWPQTRISISLSPASLPKRGSCSDLAIAIAILAAAGDIPADATAGVLFLGELGLDGHVRPVPGVLPAVAAAATAGFCTVMVPEQNAAEARIVPDIQVIAASTLTDTVRWLRGITRQNSPLPCTCGPDPCRRVTAGKQADSLDLADVYGLTNGRRALEICAAGGHHLSLTGPPGTGKTLLAERLPTILPELDAAQALDVTAIHSVAGTLPSDAPLLTRPPFMNPHHTSSKAAITGGGTGTLRPGAASLAHRGVLFLDQAPEFSRDVLDALRQPLETGEITLARSGIITTFPARFLLVLTANPCPCANTADPSQNCTCTAAMRRRYLSRLSGPLLDRVDVKVELSPVNSIDLLNNTGLTESSAVVAARVAAARYRAAARWNGTPWRLNAEVPASELSRHWHPGPGALTIIDQARQRGQVSDRGAVKVLRVAWTLADLAGRDRPGSDECAAALDLWLGVAR